MLKKLWSATAAGVVLLGLAAAPAHAAPPADTPITAQQSICDFIDWWPGCEA